MSHLYTEGTNSKCNIKNIYGSNKYSLFRNNFYRCTKFYVDNYKVIKV